MHEVEIKISNTTVKLMCEDEKKLMSITELLDQKISELKNGRDISDLKAFFITSIYLIDELQSLREEMQLLKAKFYDTLEIEKGEVRKNYERIAGEIEKITKLIDENL